MDNLKEIILELNQRASSGRRNRVSEWSRRKSEKEAADYAARKNVPLLQGTMIKITKLLRHKWGLKAVWFAAGKQDEVRMLKDCKFWSDRLLRPSNLTKGDIIHDLFGNAAKLNDLIEEDAPLLFIAPAPSSASIAQKHNIKINPEHMDQWNRQGRNFADKMSQKFDCHIGQQRIDTFMVTITTVHKSDYEVIKQYLTKWIGNYLLLSAISATLNPSIVDEETVDYDINYNPDNLEKLKPGQRLNLKVIGSATWRMDQITTLVNNNKGEVNTYELGKNYVMPHKDMNAASNMTPTLVTALTYPQFPTSKTYKCHSFTANVSNWLRKC